MLPNPASVPGMIEPVEQALLTRYAKEVDLAKGQIAVEFGAFFGRSTACLANGMVENPTLGTDSTLHVYDSFSCHKSDGFIKHVIAFARSGGVENLLTIEGKKASFLPIFQHYLRTHIDSGVVTTHAEQLRDSAPPKGPIVLMHIDSPKFYQEFKTILFRFFPSCEQGCTIVFQDYFYHWSASLIAAVELLHERGILEFGESAASSLAATLTRAPCQAELMEIDLEMQSQRSISDRLTGAAGQSRARCSDRSQVFAPRVQLALVQYLFELGDTKRAAAEFKLLIKNNSPLPPQLLGDFMELLGNGFSIRALYDRDHD
jgi:hypothetical protein